MLALDFSHYCHIYKREALQIFCATNECDSGSTKSCFLSKRMVTKKCDTNKNVTKMDMIINGVTIFSWLLHIVILHIVIEFSVDDSW
jgi:hypothetical protein